MKRRIFCLILALCMVLFSGCAGVEDLLQYMEREVVPYRQMNYVRPDVSRTGRLLEDVRTASEGENLEDVLDAIYAFNKFYDSFYTAYSLADIRYCGDVTDLYWEDEYNFCAENSAAVDAALEELYYTLARSPLRQELEAEEYFGAGFFESYDGENNWDGAFTAMLEQEAQLRNQYYDLAAEVQNYEFGTEICYDECGEEMARLLVQLIRLRREIADYWGYTDYVSFANDFYYYRDYTIDQTEAYLKQIRQELVPLYVSVRDSDNWDEGRAYCAEKGTFRYVQESAKAMGGIIADAFRMMEQGGLYDISYGENKYNSSFEVYFSTYQEPFVFLSPTLTQWDKLTFAHEFGHFCNDYASWGSYAGTDVAEVFSQGMEYLSLCYGDHEQDLSWLKLADSVCLSVEQAAFADFEMQMYALAEEQMNPEGLRQLYRQVALRYGFDAESLVDWEFVAINHYYTNPMYIISYVVSNDAALQFYQMELEAPGSGLKCFQENLDTQAQYFLEFLESAGLESPFAPGRMQSVRRTLEEALQ